MPIPFYPFPSIQLFHNVVRFAEAFPQLSKGSVKYRGKIKLHGTNAGIRIFNGEVSAQSRSQSITPNDDHMGFAKWVDKNKDYWAALSRTIPITVFGEWAGPGVMQGTAVSTIPNKIFAVFAIVTEAVGTQEATLISDPVSLREILDHTPSRIFPALPDLHVLPWFGEVFEVDFSKRGTLSGVVDSLNAAVAVVEPCDPWIKSIFNIEGVGEGIVYYPHAGEPVSIETFTNISFKAKGPKHKAVATKEAVQIDPEVAANIDDFVKMFLTEQRLEQGATAVGGTEMKSIGNFLRWVGADVQKESVAELEASGLTWDQVQKSVQAAAKTWFLANDYSKVCGNAVSFEAH